MTTPAAGPLLARSLARRVAHWQDLPAAVQRDRDGEIIDLARAYPVGLPPAHVAAAAAEVLDRGETHYVDSTGILPLREAIAAAYGVERRWQVTPDQILVTNGAQEGLFLSLRGRLRPGDEVLAPDPGYPLIQDIVRLAAANLVPVPTAADGFQMTAAALEAHTTPRTRFALLLSPSHVTGQVIPADEAARIADFALRRDVILIVDEALGKGVYAGVDYPGFASLPDVKDHLITVSSLSKFYCMSGWRIGWIAATEDRLKPLRDLKQAISICTAAVCQRAAVAALTGPKDWLTRQQAGLAARRDGVMQALDRMGMGHVRPDAALFILADVRPSGLSSEAFAERALRKAGVRVAPGSAFGPGGEGFVRLSLAEPAERLEQALKRLGDVMSGRAR